MGMRSSRRGTFLRQIRLYLIVVVGVLIAYFAYVTISRGFTYALSMENLRWFGVLLLIYSSIAALVATLMSLTKSE
jgi:hypothetical protein